MSLRCSSSSRSSPGRPVSAKRGVCRVGVAKCAFPRPPMPAAGDDDSSPGVAQVGDDGAVVDVESPACRRAREHDVVAVGAVLARPAPVAAALRGVDRLRPQRPRDREGLHPRRATTSPPRPPSPPSGPPFGTNFSRRKLRPPSPPRPALTRMWARSWNMRIRAAPLAPCGRAGLRHRATKARSSAREPSTEMKRFSPERRNSTTPSRMREDRVVAAEADARHRAGTGCRAGAR